MFDKEMDFYGKHATYLRSLAPSRQYLEKRKIEKDGRFKTEPPILSQILQRIL